MEASDRKIRAARNRTLALSALEVSACRRNLCRLTGPVEAQDIENKVTYDEIDVQALAFTPEAFRGRRVFLAGKVSGVEDIRARHLIHLEVPISSGSPNETQTVVADHAGEAPPPGRYVTVKGICDDIHIIASPNRCGLTVVPLLRAESLEEGQERA